MAEYRSFRGTVVQIEDLMVTTGDNSGCTKLFTLSDSSGNIVNFVVSPSTYFVNLEMVRVGDNVIGFYDASLPVPLIYPPQYRAIVMAIESSFMNVTVDTFNRQLINTAGTLKLNVGPFTLITLTNGQAFTGSLVNRDLVVLYDITTRSIPAQTTPIQVIVLCL